jgi:uncharacterized SAM-binding protein YcdF (DUF218 family)
MARFVLHQLLALVQPVGIVWACLVVLTIVFARFKRPRSALACGFLAALIYLVGSTGFPGWLMRGLERPFANMGPETRPQADAIVMLGGGSEPARYEAGGMHLSYAGDRIIMALELARLGKAPALVLGGGEASFPNEIISESETVKRWMLSTGLNSTEIIALPRSADTHDEAVHVSKLAKERGWKTILLVTSANHMRRALATFRTAGVNVTPAPCNFFTEVSVASSGTDISLRIPRSGGFLKLEMWLYEQIGWHYYRYKGWISREI